MLVDTHCHINDERLLPNAKAIVESLPADGIGRAVVVGSDRLSSETAVKLAAEYDSVYALIGVHPHEAKEACESDFLWIEKIAIENQKVVGIGEIGLDYYYDLSPRSVQAQVFVRQLELANALKLPISIHLRDAYGDMMKLLKDNRDKLEYGVLLHCYSGSPEYAKELLRLADIYFAFGGTLTFKNNVNAVETVKILPTDKILLETDSPYLAPVPMRGKTNLPNYVKFVAQRLTEILGITAEETEKITTENAYRLFSRLK